MHILSSEKDIEEKNTIKPSTFAHNVIDFEENELVEIEYKGTRHIGKVVRIYNNGETLNVNWDGKQTAFYYKTVKKLKEVSMKNAI